MRLKRTILSAVFLAAMAPAAFPGRAAAVCTDADGDGYFSGWPSRTENISKSSINVYAQKALALDAAGNPVIAWRNGIGVALTRWGGTAWVKMDGTPGFDQLAHPNIYQQNPTNMLMVLDAASRPHVFWTNYWAGAKHYYTRWDGAAWVRMDGAPGVEDVSALLGGTQLPSEVQLALDGNGRPYLVSNRVEYLDPQQQTYVWGIFLTRWDGTKWAAMNGTAGAELLSGTAASTQRPKLVIDAANKPWVSWESPLPGEVSLTRWDGEKWAKADGTPGVEIVSTSELPASQHQLALHGQAGVALAWNETSSDPAYPTGVTRLLFTRWDGAKWARMDGAPGQDVVTALDMATGFNPLLQHDAAGNPVVVWSGPLADGFPGVLVSRWNGAAWSSMDGQSANDQISMRPGYLNVALDSNGWPNLVSSEFTDHYTLMFRRWNGSGWTARQVLSIDDRGAISPLIAIGPGNVQEIIWTGMNRVGSSSVSNVYYTHWTAAGWAPRVTTCGTLGDCNDANPFVNPAASEVCTDGVDNNCNGRVDAQDAACPQNRAPVANAGADQAGRPGGTATLDGSMSTDPDGNYPLSYAWTLTAKPEGSQAALAGADTVHPSFVMDIPGDYAAQLVVTDALGLAGTPDETRVSSVNTAPTAEAGPDQALLLVGSSVQLDGTQSFDPDGDPITYRWEILERPPDSQAALSDPTSAAPSFVADSHGDYVVQLTVRDPWVDSAPDTVRVSFQNVRPIAAAGTNRAVLVGDTVPLDGSGSSDANGDSLLYQWALVSVPAGSQAAIAGAASPQAAFVADQPGLYVVSLVVDDRFELSEPSNVTILALTWQDALEEALVALMDRINGLADVAYRNNGNRDTLAKKVSNVLQMVEAGDYRAALEKLENDVMGKFAGCASTGAPDNGDWIVSCDAQQLVSAQAERAAALLRGYAF